MRVAHIAPDATVNDVIALHPRTIAVFNALGIDACCGGAASLGEAAARDGVDLATLLQAIDEATLGDDGKDGR